MAAAWNRSALKTVYGVTLAGDDEPVPMAQRPIARAMVEATDARECLANLADRLVNRRSWGWDRFQH